MYLVDYHVHLEEGPYDLSWLNKLCQAFNIGGGTGTKEELIADVKDVLKQLEIGNLHQSYLDLYLQQAIKLGIKEVGMVDHLYRFFESRAYYEQGICLDDSEMGQVQLKWLNSVMVTQMSEFVTLIQSEKEKWERHGVKLRLGIEVDYFKGLEKEVEALIKYQPWDFVIGSVHFNQGWGFDNVELKSHYGTIDLLEGYASHFETVSGAIQSELFDIVAHLDNFKVFGYRPDEEALLPYYEKIAEQLVQYGVATEVNSGLLYRYPIAQACPSPTFLDVLIAKGVSLTTSSDAHFPYHLGMKVEDSLLHLKDKGIDSVVTFENRQLIKRSITK